MIDSNGRSDKVPGLVGDIFSPLYDEIRRVESKLQTDLSAKERELASLRHEVEILSSSLSSATLENREVSTKLGASLSEIEKLNSRLAGYQEQVALDQTNLLDTNVQSMRYVGIPDLERRKEESIIDSIVVFKKECPYCGKNLYEGNIRDRIEIDHFFPIAKGGQDYPWNLLPVCKECNRKKKDIMPFTFLGPEKYRKCYDHLLQVKLKMSNTISEDLLEAEVVRNLIKTHEIEIAHGSVREFATALLEVARPYLQYSSETETSQEVINVRDTVKILLATCPAPVLAELRESRIDIDELRLHLTGLLTYYKAQAKKLRLTGNAASIKAMLKKGGVGLPRPIVKNSQINKKVQSSMVYKISEMSNEWKQTFHLDGSY